MKLYRSNTVDKSSYEANYNSWFAGLPVDVQAVVWDYTESGYKSLNAWLRGEISDLTGALSHKAQTLEAALTASAGFQGPTTLFRGVKALQELPAVGSSIKFDAFTSTTSDPHQVFKFVDQSSPIIFEITTDQAQEISYLHDEFEFLLPKSTEFKVVGIHENVHWNAEYPGTSYSKSLESVIVVQLQKI